VKADFDESPGLPDKDLYSQVFYRFGGHSFRAKGRHLYKPLSIVWFYVISLINCPSIAIMQAITVVISLLIIAGIIYAAVKKNKLLQQPPVELERQLLLKYVMFYQALPAMEKTRFEQSLRLFLQKVRITGVRTTVAEMDMVFVAAAAIIPIFAFKDWEYRNIHEVLLYPGSFDKDYHTAGSGRNTLGMVGNGPLQNVMILSQQDLRNGFIKKTGTSNTAIHEFVHLVDKADGDTDGLPAALLPHRYALPWLKRMHREIQQIAAGKSDINPYGATNEAEFLAVAAEYFFEQPHLMQQKHPDLFVLLQKIFTPITATAVD
jgi:Mlc titration factor MtfA (ptsG expression regulator)